MVKQKLSAWQKKTKTSLIDWASDAKAQLSASFKELCQQDKISDEDFVLALKICNSMVRPSRWSFASHACFDKNLYENWLNGYSLPEPQVRQSMLNILWTTAEGRELSDVEKMIYAFDYDFDIPSTVTSPAEPVWIKATTASERSLLFDPWIDVKDLDLSSRTLNCIMYHDAQYLGQIVLLTENILLNTSNFGRKSLEEVKFILSTKGAYLGMTHPELDIFLADIKAGKTKPE